MENATKPILFDKKEGAYNLEDRNKEFKDNTSAQPLTRDDVLTDVTYTSSLYADEGVVNTNLLSLKNFEVFNTELTADSFEDSYENTKYASTVHTQNYQHLATSTLNNPGMISYVNVMDAFRPDFEEKTVHTESTAHEDTGYGIDPSQGEQGAINPTNLSNPFKLRASAKNAIVTYNAMQKVFRARFDEGRSHARLQDFSNSYIKHPFVTDTKVPYESLLGKNKNSFLDMARYNHSLSQSFSDMTQVYNSLNVYLADLPFLVSMKSDPSRYLWFD